MESVTPPVTVRSLISRRVSLDQEAVHVRLLPCSSARDGRRKPKAFAATSATSQFQSETLMKVLGTIPCGCVTWRWLAQADLILAD
jgi:hypothetical protein